MYDTIWLDPRLTRETPTARLPSAYLQMSRYFRIQRFYQGKSPVILLLSCKFSATSRGRPVSSSPHTDTSSTGRTSSTSSKTHSLSRSHPRPTAASQQHLLGNFLGSALQSRGRTKTWNCPQPVRSSWSGPRTVGGFNLKPGGGGQGGRRRGWQVAAPQTQRQPRHAWLQPVLHASQDFCERGRGTL